MTDMTSEQVKRLDMRAIEKIFRETARKERVHKSITNEDALDLVNIVAIHGDRLADAIGLFFHAEPASPHSPGPRVDEATMREMLRLAEEQFSGCLGDEDRAIALAFGRALMERKP